MHLAPAWLQELPKGGQKLTSSRLRGSTPDFCRVYSLVLSPPEDDPQGSGGTRGLEIRVFLLLDGLPDKAIELRLPAFGVEVILS